MDNGNGESIKPEVDLESGGTTYKDSREKDAFPPNSLKKKSLKRALGGVLRFDRLPRGNPGGDASVNSFRVFEDSEDKLSVLVDKNLKENDKENVPLLDKKHVQERRASTNSRKAPKPPRPPKGPLLDAADQRLVKDVAEVTMRKRLRMERMEALKKAKATAGSKSSTTSTVAAMLVTILFFIIIVFHGFSSRTEPRLPGHSESDVPMSFISGQHFDNASSDERRSSISGSSSSH